MARWTALVLVLLVCGLGAAACGGDDESAGDTTATEETTTEETTEETAAGREVFLANCGSCHTLSDAGTTGTVGPELDGIGLSADEVADQVRNGGGGMPSFEDQLDEDEIEAVAAYVAGSG
jgi:mono/diheme cytochrome c family protein